MFTMARAAGRVFSGAREATAFGAPPFLGAVASLPSVFPRYSALGPGFPQQPTWLLREGLVIGHQLHTSLQGPLLSHVATKGRPSYRAPAPHLTAGAPALPTDVQALSQLVAQQVVQQLWGSHHPPPCPAPAYPPVPVTSHTGWAADQGSLASVSPLPRPVLALRALAELDSQEESGGRGGGVGIAMEPQQSGSLESLTMLTDLCPSLATPNTPCGKFLEPGNAPFSTKAVLARRWLLAI